MSGLDSVGLLHNEQMSLVALPVLQQLGLQLGETLNNACFEEILKESIDYTPIKLSLGSLGSPTAARRGIVIRIRELSSFNPSTIPARCRWPAVEAIPSATILTKRTGCYYSTISICSGKSASRSPRVPQQQGLSIPT